MSYINTLISSSGTEADFIKTFVSELIKYHGISVSIPQEYNTYNNFNDYIEAMYADTTSKPKFILSLNGLNITFERSTTASNITYSYRLSSNMTSPISLAFSQSGSAGNSSTNAVRAFRLCIATNDKNIIALYLGDSSDTLASASISIVGISMPENIDGFAISTYASQRAITQAFSLNNNRSASKIDRCNYLYESTSNATNIEVIKNKIFVASGGSSSESVSKMFSFDDMWDVSEIPAETKLSINGKNYFSLDSHTIIEI